MEKINKEELISYYGGNFASNIIISLISLKQTIQIIRKGLKIWLH